MTNQSSRSPPLTNQELSLTSSDQSELSLTSSVCRKILSEVKSVVQPGVTTDTLDHLARELTIIHQVSTRKQSVIVILILQAYPSPLNFNGYPKSITTSGGTSS